MSAETADLALKFLSPLIQHLESEEVFSNGKTTYPLTRINAKLLMQFRQFLIPGKSYQLRYCKLHFKIRCKFGPEKSSDEATLLLSGWPEDEQVNMICDTAPVFPVLFQVVEGTRIPRFTVSFSISSFICSIDGPTAFFATLVVTSLEDLPVTVYLRYDRFVDLYLEEHCWRWSAKGSDDFLETIDETTDKPRPSLHSHPQKQYRDPLKVARDGPTMFQFHKDATFTLRVQ